MPNLIPIESSMITHIGHKGDVLHVVYKGGKTYTYAGVSADKYQALLASDSKGQHINQHIKSHHVGKLS